MASLGGTACIKKAAAQFEVPGGKGSTTRMNNNSQKSKQQRQKSKSSDDITAQKIRSDRWAETLRRIHPLVAKAKGSTARVFLALQSHADIHGYCWPLISTLQKFTGIKDRDTITDALRDLKFRGIIDRAYLISSSAVHMHLIYIESAEKSRICLIMRDRVLF